MRLNKQYNHFQRKALNVSTPIGINAEQILKTTSAWNNDSLADYFKETPEVTVLKILIEPQAKLPVHMHPEISVSYILTGELTVISDTGDERTFNKGQSFVCLVNQYHYGQNKGDVPVEVLVVYVGKKGKPITLLQNEDYNI